MAQHKPESHSHGSGKVSEFGAKRGTSEISAEQRERMIAEAAYFLAEHRQFQGGDPVQDWLQAQKEIDSKNRVSSH